MFGTKILEERKSKFNGNIRVLKTWGMGTYIQVGGLTQSGGIVSTIWESTLSKIRNPKLEIRKVLILGLGGGTVAKLVRQNWPDAKITGVEIDKNMVELGKKYLELRDVDIKIGDALKFRLKKHDLIIVDTYLGDKFVDLADFNFKNAKLVIFNRLYYRDKKSEAEKFGKKLQKIFNKVEYYYPPANLMFFCYNK